MCATVLQYCSVLKKKVKKKALLKKNLPKKSAIYNLLFVLQQLCSIVSLLNKLGFSQTNIFKSVYYRKKQDQLAQIVLIWEKTHKTGFYLVIQMEQFSEEFSTLIDPHSLLLHHHCWTHLSAATLIHEHVCSHSCGQTRDKEEERK